MSEGARTRAEQETTFRWDNDEKTLQACTASPRVAQRWREANLPVEVLGRYRDGSESTWTVDLPWTGHKRPWIEVFSTAIPHWAVAGVSSGAAETEETVDDDRG